jgi:hypothetical protein
MPHVMATQNQFTGITSSRMSTSSVAPAPPFQSGIEWNPRPQGNTIDVAFGELPSDLSPSHTSNSSLPSTIGSSPLESDLDYLAPPAKANKLSGMRRIIAKNTTSSLQTSQGINNLSRQRVKKVGRRHGPLPFKKKQKVSQMRGKACARCFANHVEVSWQ